eukprot:9022575-Prorocentrum_lima.AAC.1
MPMWAGIRDPCWSRLSGKRNVSLTHGLLLASPSGSCHARCHPSTRSELFTEGTSTRLFS